ncbi:MAG: amylo-alpha-1,6-glucosidase [Cyanobacteria bacterium P01_A01_bin.116]
MSRPSHFDPPAVDLGRDICGHVAESTQREWLITNGIGGYGSGTLSGILTRCYHGLLVAALKPPLGRTLLLTKLDETLTYHRVAYPLSCDRWSGGTTTGHGYRHLERFHLEGTIPTWTYACADARLEKRIWMQPGENTTYVQYRLRRATAPVSLAIKAIVNYRDHHHTTQCHHDGQSWNIQTKSHPRGLQITAFEAATAFYLLSSKGQMLPTNRWYQHYFLTVEKYRGLTHLDDHFHAATLRTQLNPGETLTVACSTEPHPNLDEQSAIAQRQDYEDSLLQAFEHSSAQQVFKQQVSRQQISKQFAPNEPELSPGIVSGIVTPAWISQLALAAHQFVVDRAIPPAPTSEEASGETSEGTEPTATEQTPPVGKTIIAGYPWFGDWGRDTMIALPGLTLTTGRPQLARPILQTFARYLSQGMLPNAFPEANDTPGYNTVDAILWYFEAIRAYMEATGEIDLLQTLFPALKEVIQWHLQGTRYNIGWDSRDGLISAGQAGMQLTWMDAKVDDWVVTPRIGKPVEINALWHHALGCMVSFARQLGEDEHPYLALAAQAAEGFQKFWQPGANYCFDVIEGPSGNDASLRPNQLFAVSLAYGPPLSFAQQKAIVDTCAQQLLTSYGLRSLSLQHDDYVGVYGGDRVKRDGSYHQGTTWGWLIGPFVQAHLKVYKDPAVARTFLEPFAHHLQAGCTGTLSEIFDGNAPFTPRGAFAQAWSVAEVLRAWQLTQQPDV